MGDNSEAKTYVGILELFIVLLTVLFVGLKLTGNITWSWFWVLSPMIFCVGFPIVLVIVILLIVLGVLGVFAIKAMMD